MLTFGKLWEFTSQPETQENQAMAVVKSGSDIPDFWDNFIALTGNADGMAELFDVPREKITALAGRINHLLSKVDKDQNQEDEAGKKTMMPTGDN